VFSRRGGEVFLRERVNALLGIVETIESIAAVCQRWPQAVKKYIEYAANGPAVIALMRRKVGGFIPVTPTGSKVARMVTTAGYTEQASGGRAVAASEIIQSGSYYIPHPMLPWCVCGAPDWTRHDCPEPRRAKPWVWEYVDTFAAFPNVAHDEDVDVAAYGIMKLQPWIWREADRAQEAAVKVGIPAASVAEVHRNRITALIEGETSPKAPLNPYRRS
jgi:phage terminase large subunit-like protein